MRDELMMTCMSKSLYLVELYITISRITKASSGTPVSIPDFLLLSSECDESSASDSGDQAAWHSCDSASPAPAHHACFYPAAAAFPSDTYSTAPI